MKNTEKKQDIKLHWFENILWMGNDMQTVKRIQMVTFDLDGTIIDDEWAHEQAKTEIAKSLLGFTEDLELSKFTGHSNRLFWQDVCRKAGVNGDIEDLTNRQFQRVMELVVQNRQPESTGLTDTMRYLKQNEIRVALTSGSDKYFVDSMLDYLQIRQYVDVKVTKDHVRAVKPDPDIYLAAQKMAGMPSNVCSGIEDSIAGCQALHGAGMISVGYTNQGKNPQNLQLADYRIAVMTDIIPLLERLNNAVL